MWRSKAHINMNLFLISDTNKNSCHWCSSIQIHFKLLNTVGVIYNSYITLNWAHLGYELADKSITFNNTFLIRD